MDRIELENRLVGFSTAIIALCKDCRFDEFTAHLSKQVVRSGSSAALNYGEAQSAESRADFIHKMSIVLKELRETHINLTIMKNTVSCNNPEKMTHALDECKELVAIFQKSVTTLKSKK